MIPKVFLGPMSYNIVNAVLHLDIPLGLIPSRRQVEYNTGYVGLTTEELYRITRGSKVTLCRDHAGPNQGSSYDDGLLSLKEDSKYFDVVHIDPWKEVSSIDEAIEKTYNLITFCLQENPSLKFEVGTEEAIFPYSPKDLFYFLSQLKVKLGSFFQNITFAVVQSGTELDLPCRKNTGNFDIKRLKDFIEVCNTFGVCSKEHNGDYLLDNFGIAFRFESGLHGINIAPEIGQIETEYYIYKIGSNSSLFERLYLLCYESRKWEKWISKEVSPQELVLTAGHYILNTSAFKEKIKKEFPEADFEIQEHIKTYVKKVYLQANGYET